MDYQALSNNIQKYRKQKHLTQEQLAEQLDVSSQAVSKWENGISCPDIALLPALAKIFEISIDDLFNHTPIDTVSFHQKIEGRNISDILLKVRVISKDGDKVNINLPMALIKAFPSEVFNLQLGGEKLADNIDFDMIVDLADKGVMGKLVEVNSADGSYIEVYIE